MRRLLILRHAKAAAPSSGTDFDRPLTPRGRADAQRVGRWLGQCEFAADYAIHSGAARTRETLEIVAGEQPRPIEASEQNALYEASPTLILDILRNLPNRAQTALVVGHNPGLGAVAAEFARDPAQSARLGANFPTCGLAIIVCSSADWSDLAADTCRLERFVAPDEV